MCLQIPKTKAMKETIKTKVELEELNNALSSAVTAAKQLANTEDGGSCNFDSVTLRISIPATLAEQACVKLEKMLVRDWGRLWRGHYMVDIPLSGQADRRSCMAEAACKSLRESGYDAHMFYMVD